MRIPVFLAGLVGRFFSSDRRQQLLFREREAATAPEIRIAPELGADRRRPPRGLPDLNAPALATRAGQFAVVDRFARCVVFGPAAWPLCLATRRRLNLGRRLHPFMIVNHRGRPVSTIRKPGRAAIAA